MSAVIREQLNHWLGVRRDCDCGVAHGVGTRIVDLHDAGWKGLTSFVDSLDNVQSIGVVGDANTWQAAGDSVAAALRKTGIGVFDFVYPDTKGGGALVPDDAAVALLADRYAAESPGAIVGCGSGTIGDLCKYVAAQHGVPFVSVATAASMNGYTSAVAALKQHGLKVTLPVTPAAAVFGDAEIWRNAPFVMTAAGFADLLSKFTCESDWRLSALVEGAYYCSLPAKLAAVSADEVVGVADAVGRAEPAAIETVMWASMLSGAAMAVAGSSAPSSGAEHLVSHYWDMTAPHTGGRRFHGTQVGIGLLLCATLYERLRALNVTDIRPVEVAENAATWPELENRIAGHFTTQADAVLREARKKHRSGEAARDRANQLQSRWNTIRDEILSTVASVDQIRDWLHAAGAPTTAADLGVSNQQVVDAVRWCRHIRSRYTCFDLAAEIGHFEESHRADMIARSGVFA